MGDTLFGHTPSESKGYVTSPQQEKLFETLIPFLETWIEKTSPGITGVTAQPYVEPDIAQYAGRIPDVTQMMPTKGWYEGIEPGIKEAVWEPYMEGADKLREELGGIGAIGNPRAGMSGAAADVFSDYFQDASSKVAGSLWNMTSPALQAGWQAETDTISKALEGALAGAQTSQAQAYSAQIDPMAAIMGGVGSAIPDTYFAPEGREPGLIGKVFK